MLKRLGKIGFVAGMVVVSALILCAVFLPDQYGAMFPYRFYYVLTNSMEPTVATNSLVLVKTCEDPGQIRQGDIMVFRANRFGETVLIMHRFSHTERNEAGDWYTGPTRKAARHRMSMRPSGRTSWGCTCGTSLMQGS